MTASVELTKTCVGERAFNPQAMSYYLGLRHLPVEGLEWIPGVAPALPESIESTRRVSSSTEILESLNDLMPRTTGTGILLSGGIDSAILAALAEPGTPCFTISFDAPGAADESIAASTYASRWGHPHHIIRVSWDDYLTHTPMLMAHKKSPLHPVEVPLHVAAQHARGLGVQSLLVGNGADSTFGGMDKLLCPVWTYEQFIERYRFVDPALVLRAPMPIEDTFAPYRRKNEKSGNDGIAVQQFLREIHGQGIVQSFENAIGSAGVDIVAPYEAMIHDGELDLDRIRAGEPKYLLQQVFRDLYATSTVPTKIPFARPMDVWMADWDGAVDQPLFRGDVAEHVETMSGDARFLVWCLDRFITQLNEQHDE